MQLWQKGNLFDLEVKCNGLHVMRASKVDLAVYSGYFQTFFDSQFPEAASQEVNIEGAEPAVLESIIKALYEKEVHQQSFQSTSLGLSPRTSKQVLLTVHSLVGCTPLLI